MVVKSRLEHARQRVCLAGAFVLSPLHYTYPVSGLRFRSHYLVYMDVPRYQAFVFTPGQKLLPEWEDLAIKPLLPPDLFPPIWLWMDVSPWASSVQVSPGRTRPLLVVRGEDLAAAVISLPAWLSLGTFTFYGFGGIFCLYMVGHGAWDVRIPYDSCLYVFQCTKKREFETPFSVYCATMESGKCS